jgi:exo-1,4-beta-D-glucosaminidase
MWMFNSAWPKLQWQLFDYSLAPTSAFYATRKACEPLHIQYDPVKHDVIVVNRTLTSRDNLSAEARVINFDGSQAWEKRGTMSAAPNGATKGFFIPKLDSLAGVYFLELTLHDTEGNCVSQSTYCLSIDPKYDLSDLAKLPQVEIRATQKTERSDGQIRVTVELQNDSQDQGSRGNIAFFVALHLTKGDDMAPLGPVFLDDNYISILTGQTQTIRATVPATALSGEELHLGITGWNIRPLKLF